MTNEQLRELYDTGKLNKFRTELRKFTKDEYFKFWEDSDIYRKDDIKFNDLVQFIYLEARAERFMDKKAPLTNLKKWQEEQYGK